MVVGDGAWSEHARRRGRAVGRRLILAGSASSVAIIGVLVVVGMSRWLRVILLLALLPSVQLILQGRRRRQVESFPSVHPPLALPAVSDPGWFAGLPEPRPTFGLRLRFRPLRGALYIGPCFLLVVVVAAIGGAVPALIYGALVLAGGIQSTYGFLRDVPLEVRVTPSTIEWTTRLRRAVTPVASLRRLRCKSVPSTAVVFEFEGHRSRFMLVTGGFADFLEALTVTCPWVEVSSEIVERFGSWSGKKDGFFVESPEVAPDRR
jgi:hypothetical protein